MNKLWTTLQQRTIDANPGGLTPNPWINLRHMHQKFGFKKINRTQLQGRIDFLKEELDELQEALNNSNAVDFVDALGDLEVVICGTFDLIKVDGERAHKVIQVANLSKELGFNEKRPNSEGQDLVKPDGWEAPDHFDNIGILPEIMNDDSVFYASKISDKPKRYAVNFLQECIDLLNKKGGDYNYHTPQSEYYRNNGLNDLLFNLREKYLRIENVVKKKRDNVDVNFDGIKDSLRDLAVFSAFMAEWNAGEMEGQEGIHSFGDFNDEK